jgi:squalene-hopene/tetraprenyl-beta-curcumene cyclase
MPKINGIELDTLRSEAFGQTLSNARQRLLDERNEQGWWTGELSSSALSTATGIVAIALAKKNGNAVANEDDVRPVIKNGAAWLISKQNDDGGWGDTDKSISNISTTLLCWAALGLVGEEDSRETLLACERWLVNHVGSLEVSALVESVMERYGKDRTFSVPILMMCTLCGRFGDTTKKQTWHWVKQLPFELAALPQRWFKKVNLQVVSYALPALIAIGQLKHHHKPTWNPISRLYRNIAKKRTLAVLKGIQPSNGGYLEATPLTSFVTMALSGAGQGKHAVVDQGVRFILGIVREDGSWPIDTNLATWVTTLSVNALAAGGKIHQRLDRDERGVISEWLLGQQYKQEHPYTGAAPGGWAWTDLPGGVPDADDTSGAVLALAHLQEKKDQDEETDTLAMKAGCDWLAGLINRDGGVPTFCRGWGRLPFDRSSTDISAHTRRAFRVAFLRHALEKDDAALLDETYVVFFELVNGIDGYLKKQQASDGSWSPLWFGNQHNAGEVNPVYGTSRVLLARDDEVAVNWLCTVQQDDGGWNGGSDGACSIEETAVAVEALAKVIGKRNNVKPHVVEALVSGVNWLIEHTKAGTEFPASPIGFYFAKLWYYEKLYPIIFTVAALERVNKLLQAN